MAHALASSSPSPRLYLLGAFRLECNSQTIHLPTRKAESLLAFLTLHPETHSREKLAARFWGDASDAQARASLRNALAVLRSTLGEQFLLTTRDAVQVNPDYPLWVDTTEFSQIARLASQSPHSDFQAALAMYHGDLLTDCYDEWVLEDREYYRRLYATVLLLFIQHLRSQSDYSRAIEAAHQLAACDPTNEEVYQNLMFCYQALGDKVTALKQYEECRRVLRLELGVEPLPETTALYQRIRQESMQHPSPAALPTNLPIPLTSFVGRQREIAQVRQLIETTRLLTLAGAGGCGKTRLAVQSASELVEAFRDGVWWVELASLSDESLVPHAVAKALGVRQEPHRALNETLVDYLRPRQLLLVLDNCEHLVGACAQLCELLLWSCPQLKLLVTSREVLGVLGGMVWHVPSLSLPDPRQPFTPETLGESEAAQLFIERAAAVNPDLTWTAGNARAVAEICLRLDGIPLALELAAARLNVLSAEQIVQHLDDRFQLLTTGQRAALPRHRTLRAAMDWSYDLLTQTEQTFLRRLSVFAGGFSLEAAVAIAWHTVASDGEHATTSIAVLGMLSRLVDRSLLMVEHRGESARYRLLETIRQYALERLIEAGEEQTARQRHLDFFLKLTEETASTLTRPERSDAFIRLEQEHDNLRVALAWSLKQGETTEVDAEMVLRLAVALDKFWDACGYWREGCESLERALSASRNTRDARLRAAAHLHTFEFAYKTGDFDVAQSHLEESQRLYTNLEDTRGVARALQGRAALANRQNDQAARRSFLEQSLALFESIQDMQGISDSLEDLGSMMRNEGNLAAARSYYTESLRLRQQIGDKTAISAMHGNLAFVAFYEGDYATARSHFEQYLELAKERGDKSAMRHALVNLGELARTEGNDRQAAAFYEASLALARELHAQAHICCCLINLGYVAQHQGNLQRARRLFEESLTYFQEQGLEAGVAFVVEGLASVIAAEGKPQEAARLLGAVNPQLLLGSADATPADRVEHERTLAAVHAQLDQAAFDAAWAEGCAMSLEQALEYALNAERVTHAR